MRISIFNLMLIVMGLAVVGAIAAIAWRAVSEEAFEYDGRDIRITADYIGHCQTMSQECYAAADAAIDWALAHHRVAEDCLAHRPSRRTIARGALIWLNAHVELHPLPVEEGITRAADAIWPCKR